METIATSSVGVYAAALALLQLGGQRDSGRRISRPRHPWLRVIAKTPLGEKITGSWHRVLAKTALVTHRTKWIAKWGSNFSSIGVKAGSPPRP